MRQNLAFFATVPNMKQLSKNEAKTSTTIKRAKIFPKQSQPTPFSCTKNVLLLPHSCLITKFFFQVIPVVDCVTYYKKISKIATIDWVHTHLRNNKHFNFLIVVKIHLFWHFFLTYSIFKFYQLFQLAVYYRVFFMNIFLPIMTSSIQNIGFSILTLSKFHFKEISSWNQRNSH